MTISRDIESLTHVTESIWSVLAGEGSATIAQLQSLNLDLPHEQVALLLELLDEPERQRASRFHFERHRQRFIVGRARLRQVLGLHLGLDPRDVRFIYGKQDKPALAPDHRSELRFNLSHCASLGLLGVTHARDIGVDVERLRNIENEVGLAADCFSQSELQAYNAAPAELRNTAFFNAWTRKEAFIKAVGEGLSYPLKNFDVSLLPGDPVQILRVGTQSGSDSGWGLVALSPAAGFVAAAVIAGSHELRLARADAWTLMR